MKNIESKIETIDLEIDRLRDHYYNVLYHMPDGTHRRKLYEDWQNEIRKPIRAKKRLVKSTIVRPEMNYLL